MSDSFEKIITDLKEITKHHTSDFGKTKCAVEARKALAAAILRRLEQLIKRR